MIEAITVCFVGDERQVEDVFDARLWIRSIGAISSIDCGAQTCKACPSCDLTKLRYKVRRTACKALDVKRRSPNVAKNLVGTHTLLRYVL